MQTDITERLMAATQTTSREGCATALAASAGVSVHTAKRAMRGAPVQGESARKLARAMHSLGIEVSAGDLALGVEGCE
jgi:hypothetical protein